MAADASMAHAPAIGQRLYCRVFFSSIERKFWRGYGTRSIANIDCRRLGNNASRCRQDFAFSKLDNLRGSREWQEWCRKISGIETGTGSTSPVAPPNTAPMDPPVPPVPPRAALPPKTSAGARSETTPSPAPPGTPPPRRRSRPGGCDEARARNRAWGDQRRRPTRMRGSTSP